MTINWWRRVIIATVRKRESTRTNYVEVGEVMDPSRARQLADNDVGGRTHIVFHPQGLVHVRIVEGGRTVVRRVAAFAVRETGKRGAEIGGFPIQEFYKASLTDPRWLGSDAHGQTFHPGGGCRCQGVSCCDLGLFDVDDSDEIERASKARLAYLTEREFLPGTVGEEIAALGLSTRTRNALYRSGYRTVGQVKAGCESGDRFDDVRNLGAKGIQEIEAALVKRGSSR